MIRLIAALALMLAPIAPALARDDDQGSGWIEAPQVQPLGKTDRVYGEANARFSLIVWLDPECPYCKLLGDKPLHVVDGAAGAVNLAIRLYPLPDHGANAVLAATTALCVADQAGAPAYYRFLSQWMARTASGGRGIGPATGGADPVAALAAAAGAHNRETLNGCTTASATARRLAAEMQAAETSGIEGTPAIAIRDNRAGHTIMISGAIEESDFRNALKALRDADDDTPAGPPQGTTR